MSIPLTFDWSTLTWLQTRLHLWWRQGRVSPSLALVCLLGIATGCVPVTRFEETQSAAQVEMEGRRRSEYQVAQLEAENTELLTRLQEQRQALDARDQALSQAQLDSATQGKQREDAEGMVEQLRGELARVGGHLQTFHDDRQKLETALEVEAARGRALSRLSRDASLALSEPLATGEYSLDAEQASVVLRVPRERVLADDGALKPEAVPLLKAVSRLLQLHPAAKLRVEDTSAMGDQLAVSRVVGALSELDVGAQRIEPLDDDNGGGPPTKEDGVAELALAFSVP